MSNPTIVVTSSPPAKQQQQKCNLLLSDYFLGIFESPVLDPGCPVQSMKSNPMELHPMDTSITETRFWLKEPLNPFLLPAPSPRNSHISKRKRK